MITRYSLKKALLGEEILLKQDLLEEGFWTDLAVTAATGGLPALQQIAQNKLQGFLGKFGSGGAVDADATLDMIKRFKKLGLKTMWGQDLATVEKEITRQKHRNKGPTRIDAKKLEALLGMGNTNESSTPFKNQSLASVFLDD